jgi:hypothetical protein
MRIFTAVMVMIDWIMPLLPWAKMATKHILPPPEEFFADDLPEMSRDEMLKMLKDLETKPPEKAPVMNVELSLPVEPIAPASPWATDPHWWTNQNITRHGLEVFALDVLIFILLCTSVWSIVQAWIYAFFS